MRMILGQLRVKKGFLFFPKSSAYSTRWLEYAEWEEKWDGKRWSFNQWINE